MKYEQARCLYEEQKWDEAIELFHSANDVLRPHPDEMDGPCEMYIERCEYFKQNPPGADWDKTWQMTSK